MAGVDIEIRINLKSNENLETVVKTLEIFTYQDNLSDAEKERRIQSFKTLTGKSPLLFELPHEEFSIFELKVLGKEVRIIFDTCLLDEPYFSDIFSTLLNIPHSNLLLRSFHSSTGAVLFLGKLKDKMEWVELEEPLKNEVLSISGNIGYDAEMLESLGATYSEEVSNSVTLLIIGENSSQETKDIATDKRINVIDESELTERIEGWHSNITRGKEHQEWLNKSSENQTKRNKPTLTKRLSSIPFFLIGACFFGGAVWLVIARLIEGLESKPNDDMVIGWTIALVIFGLSFIHFGKNALYEGLSKESKPLIGPIIYYIFGALVFAVGFWSILAGSQQALIATTVGLGSLVYGFRLSKRLKRQASLSV
jgi:hypothetical protein